MSPAVTPLAVAGERKRVTVLFCDLVDSTALAERLGPEAMHRLLQRFFDLALHEVRRYEGTLNQFLGDGFMALFGAPMAHEDHVRRALLAAIGLQRRLHEHRADFEAQYGVGLTTRMGLNTGLVVVGTLGDNLRMDYTAVGDTTNLAARLQQLAAPDTILISAATGRLAQGLVSLEALTPVQVKGKRDPIPVYKVLGLGPYRAPLAGRDERALSPLVGRERELALLDEVLEQVERGQGQAVGIVGEAGVGKSRLLYEFRQRLAGQRVTLLEGRCLSYGSVMPYLPLLDLLRSHCGITEADSPEHITEKVRIGLQDVALEPEEYAPYLLHLLGVPAGTEPLALLTPEAVKARTFATLRQMSLNSSQRQPLILVVEDLHWIDKTSEEYLAALVESLAGAPLLVLGTYRVGYHLPWLDKSYTTQLTLRRLSPQDSLTVVHAPARVPVCRRPWCTRSWTKRKATRSSWRNSPAPCWSAGSWGPTCRCQTPSRACSWLVSTGCRRRRDISCRPLQSSDAPVRDASWRRSGRGQATWRRWCRPCSDATCVWRLTERPDFTGHAWDTEVLVQDHGHRTRDTARCAGAIDAPACQIPSLGILRHLRPVTHWSLLCRSVCCWSMRFRPKKAHLSLLLLRKRSSSIGNLDVQPCICGGSHYSLPVCRSSKRTSRWCSRNWSA